MSQVRIVASLAMLYAFRMLGLFMVLPVLMLYGTQYQGATPLLLGLALGIYGLTQACLQIPLGLLSDRLGRKPVIIGGLLVFAAGSLLAAHSTSVEGLILGRALQGSGAIASAIMAMVADLTSERNRTKAMAAIGASIGIAFSLAMMLGPIVAAAWGLDGVFWLSAILSAVGILIVVFVLPTPAGGRVQREAIPVPALIKTTAADTQLLRLNWGIFTLHCVLMAVFVALPPLLETQLLLSREQHWQFYLPLLVGAFVLMIPLMLYAEKKGRTKSVFVGAVALLGASMFALPAAGAYGYQLVTLMLLFFVAFNLLESLLPSLVSKLAAIGSKGTAMGLYATSQFLGAFFGGLVGGWLMDLYGVVAIFLFCGSLAGIWFFVASSMSPPRLLMTFDLAGDEAMDTEKFTRLRGVEEVVHEAGSRRLYIRVDRRRLDEDALDNMLRSDGGVLQER